MGKVLFVTALALLLHAQLGSSYILSCYFTNWAQYRPPPAIYMPNDIDPCLCTHLLYAFATMKNNELATFEWNDVELYSQFNGLKNQNGNLKTLLSVGGWNFGSSGFSAMVASPTNRQTFINSVIVFLRKYEFDGLDIDWEYPANRGSPPQDQQLYSVLVEEMRAAFEKEAKQTNKARLLLSAAVSAGRDTISSAYEIPKLGQALDMINVMSYDFHGSWDPFTGECSPLYKSPADNGGFIYFNVDYAMNYWKNHGAPAEKLMVGFPTYGNTFTLTNAANNGIGASIAGAGTPGKYTQEAGELAYFEICGFLKDGATKVWDTPQDVPYAYKGTQWVGYDNVKSFGIKVDWLKKNNFGGAMVWTLDMDDYTGTYCGQGKYPLINVLKKGLNLESAPCNPPATPLPLIKGTTNGGDSGGSSSGGSSSGGSTSGGSSSGGTTSGTSGMDSNFCVGKATGMYADPKNKNQFYNCSQGKTYFQYCATGLVFDTSCSCCNWS
ncbi:acidic mammalian chitinase isoform X2 [Salmo trutta]|uniref:acidic mammalian chitinase isoform X2 n=1 Tax=Salmo trutta TaxID=8032 RepID=UPI00113090D6|nr:acidic mammalian chitinase-like isoform X2 [Salmo trutta]